MCLKNPTSIMEKILEKGYAVVHCRRLSGYSLNQSKTNHKLFIEANFTEISVVHHIEERGAQHVLAPRHS